MGLRGLPPAWHGQGESRLSGEKGKEGRREGRERGREKRSKEGGKEGREERKKERGRERKGEKKRNTQMKQNVSNVFTPEPRTSQAGLMMSSLLLKMSIMYI